MATTMGNKLKEILGQGVFEPGGTTRTLYMQLYKEDGTNITYVDPVAVDFEYDGITHKWGLIDTPTNKPVVFTLPTDEATTIQGVKIYKDEALNNRYYTVERTATLSAPYGGQYDVDEFNVEITEGGSE